MNIRRRARWQVWLWFGVSALVVLLGARTSRACVGSACMEIWSTADGGGALTVQWDFAGRVQTYEAFCTQDRTQCLYSAIDPGFMAPIDDPDLTDSFFRLTDGTRVNIVIVDVDPALVLNVNGNRLSRAGDSALLGTMPTIHVHPSWQLLTSGDEIGDFSISYKLTTTSSLYTESEIFTAVVTNEPPPPTETPTPTPVVTPTPGCVGDCDGDGTVTIDEILAGVRMALGLVTTDECTALDVDGDGRVTIDEILLAVNGALGDCPDVPVATFEEVQRMVFSPSCAIPTCHDNASHTANLILTADQAYAQIVNVDPDTFTARQAGLLRVKPGAPDESFLLIKLLGPPPSQGSRMPLTGGPLTAEQIELVGNWILQGAQP